uniref:Uncharacterized protein n=1 Tax=Meloidogyne floridensis TaxID=298350 RepID=A0A915PFU4_9BILA
MFIRSLILTHFLLFFVGKLPRDLVEGMRKGGKLPQTPSPKKIKTGKQHVPNAFSLTELSFLIRILEEVQENELEQNVYSIQQILFAKGIGLLREKHILNRGQLAQLIRGNRDNMRPGHFNHLMQENQNHIDTQQTAHINATNSAQILHTVGEISSKIGRLTTGYENKLNNAMNELSNTLANVVNKIELIKSRYNELSDNLNDGDRANGILNAHLGLNIENGQKINEANLAVHLGRLNQTGLHNLLNELLRPTQLEKNIYIFYNLMGVARALTHMLTNTDEPRNSYILLLNRIGMPLDEEKYQQVRINYPTKIDEATAKLTAEGRNHQDYVLDVVLHLTAQILAGTFPGLRINVSYENVNTIRNYAGIIFTVNDGSADITEHYAGENLSENEGEESSNNDTDDGEDNEDDD